MSTDIQKPIDAYQLTHIHIYNSSSILCAYISRLISSLLIYPAHYIPMIHHPCRPLISSSSFIHQSSIYRQYIRGHKKPLHRLPLSINQPSHLSHFPPPHYLHSHYQICQPPSPLPTSPPSTFAPSPYSHCPLALKIIIICRHCRCLCLRLRYHPVSISSVSTPPPLPTCHVINDGHVSTSHTSISTRTISIAKPQFHIKLILSQSQFAQIAAFSLSNQSETFLPHLTVAYIH